MLTCKNGAVRCLYENPDIIFEYNFFFTDEVMKDDQAGPPGARPGQAPAAQLAQAPARLVWADAKLSRV